MTDKTMTPSHTPLVLIILDGWGERHERRDNGIEQAQKPYFDFLKAHYPHTQVDASGPAVGLPPGIMGNSEVGHMNIGAGRIVFSGLSQIYQAIADASFFSNAAFLQAVKHVKNSGGALHLMGLVSDGAVHSHQDHLYALLQLASRHGLKDVRVHVFLDGRDTAPMDGIKYVRQLILKMQEFGVGRIASVCGRFWAMDRDQRWDRVEAAFRAICGQARPVRDFEEAILDSYSRGVGDEFMEPISVVDASGNTSGVSDRDALIFFNFRADRAREITRALSEKNFTEFERAGLTLPALFVCAAPYDATFTHPVAFAPTYPQNILGEVLSAKGMAQLRLAETEKYAHVTFFFNGGRDVVFPGEERILVKSPREVTTYDQKPEMSAKAVCDEAIKAVQSGRYPVIIMNFANADMVGHTAKPTAILQAIEAIDQCLARLVPEILQRGGCALITADHGNAEQMVDAGGEPLTAHTTNLVPLILASDTLKKAGLNSGGRLCDIAPTMLDLLGIPQPSEMTGKTLLRH
jgi:2,3-bisphosphoglycerate-independent phosphoglycerate mutase